MSWGLFVSTMLCGAFMGAVILAIASSVAEGAKKRKEELDREINELRSMAHNLEVRVSAVEDRK